MPERLETTYDGPVRVCRLTIAGRAIEVLRPLEPDRLLDDEAVHALNARDDYMPYWAYLWPGAYLLAEVVAREPWPKGRQALEIGCGLGLAGLMGLARGLKVVFSDYDAAALPFAALSAHENGFDSASYSTRLLDWRNPPDDRFEIILGADVLYERWLVPLVVNVLERMLASGGLALLAGPYRVATQELEPMLAARGFSCHSLPIDAASENGQPVRGTLHRIARRE
jgi:predicted nicotinamide N-methyase